MYKLNSVENKNKAAHKCIKKICYVAYFANDGVTTRKKKI